MSISFACSECGRTLRVREEAAGRKLRCPACDQTTVVPSGEQGTSDVPRASSGIARRSATAGTTRANGHKMIRCSSCGERISERARKCRYCGKSVAKSAIPGRRPQRRNGSPSRGRKGAEFSARVCLSEGHVLLKKHYGLFFGAGLTVLMSQALCVIPFVGLIVALFVFPHLLAGQWYIATQAAAGRNPNFDDLFVGFRRYGTVLGVYLLLQLVVIACALPLFLGGIVAAVVGRLLGSLIGFLIFAVFAGVGVWLLLRFTMQFLFALAVAVNDEDAGVIDCFRSSAKLVQERWLDLFFVLMLCSATALLFGVGFLFWGLPLFLGAYGTAYHRLGGKTARRRGRDKLKNTDLVATTF